MTKLKSGRNEISYLSKGLRLAAHLYMPQDTDKPLPAIIFARPATQVKEQASVVYGEKLAARGFALLAPDPINFGDSEGSIRNFEDTDNILAGLTDGISLLRSLPQIDNERIYGVGLCMGGAYITRLAFLEPRLRAIATISAYFDNAMAFAGMMPEADRRAMLQGAAAAREAYFNTGDVQRYDVLGGVAPDNVPEGTPQYYADAADYYLTNRGGGTHAPNYSNMVPAFQLPIDPTLNHSPYVDDLTLPTLFIRGTQAATTGPLTDAFFPKVPEPKELLEIDGAEHFDLYDRDAYVDQAVDRIADFFK